MRLRLREVDIVARFGGEEFVALLPDTGGLGANQAAASLVAAVASTPMPAPVGVTISCGVAEVGIEDSGASPPVLMQDALKRADAALFRAKQAGRNRHCADLGEPSSHGDEALAPT